MNSNGTSAGVLWALADHQGTVRDVIDESGRVTIGCRSDVDGISF